MSNVDLTVKEADGPGTLTNVKVLGVGRQIALDSKSLALSTEDKAVLDAVAASMATLAGIVTSARGAVNLIAGQIGVQGGAGAANALTQRTISSSDDPIVTAISSGASAPIPLGTNNIGHVGGTEYEAVAVSQTDQVMGATGAIGDYLAGLTVTPLTTTPGVVQIKDGTGTAITVFAGGASSVSNLTPFPIAWGAKCLGAGWKITTGANVTVVAFGDFT